METIKLTPEDKKMMLKAVAAGTLTDAQWWQVMNRRTQAKSESELTAELIKIDNKLDWCKTRQKCGQCEFINTKK